MADAAVFELVAGALEEATALDRLQARGTLRLALKQAGLDSHGVAPDEMRAVVERVLPAELTSRGVAEAARVCERLQASIDAHRLDAAPAAETPEAIFRRLAGG